jgi:excisionase family DNA binding protein
MNPEMQACAQALRRIPVDLVTTYELSLYLRCNRKSIERLVGRGILKPISIGRNWRFSRSQVIAALSVAPDSSR